MSSKADVYSLPYTVTIKEGTWTYSNWFIKFTLSKMSHHRAGNSTFIQLLWNFLHVSPIKKTPILPICCLINKWKKRSLYNLQSKNRYYKFNVKHIRKFFKYWRTVTIYKGCLHKYCIKNAKLRNYTGNLHPL